MHRCTHPHKCIYTTHTYAHTKRASGQLAVEASDRWRVAPVEFWSLGRRVRSPQDYTVGSDKWAIAIEGHWMGFCASLPEEPESKLFAPSMTRKQNLC